MNKDCVLLAVRENRLRRLEAARLLAASGVSCVFEKDPLRIGKRIEEDLERVVVLDREGYSTSFLKALEEYQKVSPGLVIVYLCEDGNTTDKQLTYHDRRISYVEYAHMKGALANVVCLARRESEILSLHPSDYQRKHPFLIVAKETMGITSGPDKWAITQKEEETDLVKRERNNRGISRRTFLKGSAAAAAVAAVASMTGCGDPSQGTTAAPTDGTLEEVPTTSAGTVEPAPLPEDEIYVTSCRSNCFQGCVLNAHVRDGKVVRMSPKAYEKNDYTGCCVKGLSLPQRTYSPTRIQYPMRRVGERGADQWERVSWEEAIKEVAEKLMTIQKTYGTYSVVVEGGSGNYGKVHGVAGLQNRFAFMIGATLPSGCYDQAFGYGTDRAIGGGVWLHGNEPTDFLNSKTIFIWGSNPVHAQPQNWRIVSKAHNQGTKLICIDPIRSATAAKCDEFVPIQPGTDLLLTMAMMKIILEEGWTDEAFMKNRSTCPALVRKDDGKYLMKSAFATLAEGEADDYYVWDADKNAAVLGAETTNPALEGAYTVEGVECVTAFTLLKARIMETDVAYAAKKTGISEAKIKELADEYAHSGASAIYANYGIDHYQNGHLWGFAIACMATLTGNLARSGCSLGGMFVNSSVGFNTNALYAGDSNGSVPNPYIPSYAIGEIFRNQSWRGAPYPLKAIVTANSNSMSNWAQQNQWFEDIFPNLDYWVVLDNEMTDCARYADMVLPVAGWLETNDLRSNFNNPYLVIQEKAIEPLYESKSDKDIFELLAAEMGLGEFFPPRDEEYWMQVNVSFPYWEQLGMSFDRIMKDKVVDTVYNGNPFVRGESAPFPTTQGRVRVYCEDPQPRTNWGQAISKETYELERMPYFKAPNEAWDENPLFAKYPLVFIQDHTRFRTHSQWYNTPVLRELDPEPYIRLNPDDAKARGIAEGDIAEMYNDRGHVVAVVHLDPAVRPGVTTMPKGWQRDQFIAGCYQELTNTSSDPMACNFAYFDTLVEVRKYEGGK